MDDCPDQGICARIAGDADTSQHRDVSPGAVLLSPEAAYGRASGAPAVWHQSPGDCWHAIASRCRQLMSVEIHLMAKQH
jgi:hypothetical protein